MAESAEKSPSAPPSFAPDQPGVKWKSIALIVAAFAVLWVIAFILEPFIGYVGIVVVGVLTVVAIGFGIYIWRLATRSRAVVDILKGATDEEGRRAALERLRAEGTGGDALRELAHAQLMARENPGEAIRILEGIDLKKAPALVQDDIRANLALMYLVQNRSKDARRLVDDIRMDRQPQAKAKALYAAVTAEAFARTGKTDDALKLLETFSADDESYGEIRPMLYRAQVYTYLNAKKRGLAKTAMQRLSTIDTNMVAAFAMKSAHPELAKMAKELLVKSGAIPKQRVKMIR
ncbi:MAG: tetratricopeptide repeat protein [Polyangiales bacterium]|nr:tetratricopeptide repeat protein [Myxococcales bacterium]